MLEGVKIIEMATYIAAPAAGGIMADWGAEVIKIEPLSGCPMRKFFDSAMTDDYPDNPVFDLDNRGKKAIAINTSTPQGAELVKKLVADADVFLTNIRPAQLEKQGLDYTGLRAANPKLVYASVTGFGLEGEERDKPGFDTAAFWAKSGLAWMMMPKGASPVPLRVAVGDHVTGLSTASGILAALLRARESGKGCLVESSLVRSAAYAVGSDMSTYLRYGRISRSRQRHEPVVAINNFYQVKEGDWIFINARPNEPDWPDLLHALELPHLAEDERFTDLRARRRNAAALVELLDARFAQLSLAEVKQRLDDIGFIWSPVQSFAQAIQDPQMIAAGVFTQTPTADGNSYRAVASPIRFGDESTDPRGRAPHIGEHSASLLEGAGVSADEIAQFAQDGIIKT